MEYDIIIIGAGPAGLTAALYALRANKKVLILEAKTYGGQILKANKVENYPGIESISGYDYATTLYNQVIKLGAIIKYETVLRITEEKQVFTKDNEYKGKAIIIATGAENRKLKLDGEDELTGKGISYCATCDGNLYKNKIVAVNGGGNSALEDALYLSDICKKVYLIHRRDTFRGEKTYLNELNKKSNVEFLINSTISKINGNDKIESIDIVNTDGNTSNIKIECLFIAIGQEPRNEAFSNIVDLDDAGYIVAKDEVYTNIKGIYVAGDARKKQLRQLTTATSDGSIAATTAIKEME